MAYPDWVLFVSEMLAMCVAITIGECIIANEVLKRTKGHELGLGFVSIGFGMAFFVAIEMFGGISASCNPAMFLAKGVCGKKDWWHVFIGMSADFIGAFLGAIFVWILYMGHFSLVPEPPKTIEGSPDSEEARKLEYFKPLLDPIDNVPEYNRNSYISYTGRDPSQRAFNMFYQGADDLRKRGPRATMQVADLLHKHDEENTALGRTGSAMGRSPVGRSHGSSFSGAMSMEKPTSTTNVRESTDDLILEGPEDIEFAAYEAALIQDQNAKLSVFATRPAILNFYYNFQVEFVGTFFLIYCALMIEERPNFLPEEMEPIWKAFVEPFFLGWMVCALVMAMAGPTGYAANPARDMGPRIAHFVLPIPNKGPSEFWYSWVPFFGSLSGGFVAGLAFFGTQQLYHAGNAYPEWALPGASKSLFGA